MCGLVGILGDKGVLAWKRKEIFSQLLFIDTLRGKHSTGVATLVPNATPEEGQCPWDAYIYKKAVAGPDFINLDGYDAILDTFDRASLTMGHNRYRTNGDISDRNAHPFMSGHIVLAHNGALTGKGGLAEWNLSRYIDSQNIAINMANMGEKECLEGLDGTYCLTWFNLQDGSFNIARNKERNVYYAAVKGENTLLYASEPYMLYMIAARTEIELEKMFYPPIGQQVKFHPEDVRETAHVPFKEYTWGGYRTGGYKQHGLIPANGEVGATGPFQNRANGRGATIKGGKHPKELLKELHEQGFKADEEEIMSLTAFEPYKKKNMGSVWGVIYRGEKAWKANMVNVTRDFFEKNKNISWHKVRICALQLQDDMPTLVVSWIAAVTPGQEVKLASADKKSETVRAVPKRPSTEIGLIPAPKTTIAEGRYFGPRGLEVTAAVYDQCIADGCEGCGDKVKIRKENSENVLWTDEKDPRPICPDCYKDPMMMLTLGYRLPESVKASLTMDNHEYSYKERG